MKPSTTTIKGQIKKWQALSLDIEREHGKRWYQMTHNRLKEFAESRQVNLTEVCGVFAVLSPRKSVSGNFKCLRGIYDCGKGQTFKALEIKALAIKNAHGHDNALERYLKGAKVISFFDNCLWPTMSQLVTLDGHMLRLLYGQSQVTPTKYLEIAEIFKEVALGQGLLPHQLQAQLWLTYKRVMNRHPLDDIYQERLRF